MLLQTHQKTFWGETKRKEARNLFFTVVSLRTEKKIKAKIGCPTKKEQKNGLTFIYVYIYVYCRSTTIIQQVLVKKKK